MRRKMQFLHSVKWKDSKQLTNLHFIYLEINVPVYDICPIFFPARLVPIF